MKFLASVLAAACLGLASGFSPSAPGLGLRGTPGALSLRPASAARAGARGGAVQTRAFFNFGTILGGGAVGGANVAEKRAEKVLELRSLISAAPKNGVGASEELRKRIEGVCGELAGLNPTKNQAKSDLLNGSWDLLFTTTGGASAGKLGPFVGDVEQDIDVQGNRYFNIVRLGPIEAVLSAHWDVVGGDAWNVIFDDIKFSVLGLKVIDRQFGSEGRDKVLSTLDEAAEGKKDTATRNAGTWKMTYTSENLRILEAQGSDPAQPPNIYILSKPLSVRVGSQVVY